MTSPESPLEKKAQTESIEEVLTLEERVGRLEIVIERAFNALAKNIHENDLRNIEQRNHLEGELTKTLTIMNLGTLQNVVTLRELMDDLVEKNLISKEELEAQENAIVKSQSTPPASV
jgi:hypothetical protein